MIINPSELCHKRIYLYILLLAILNYDVVKNVEAANIQQKARKEFIAHHVMDIPVTSQTIQIKPKTQKREYKRNFLEPSAVLQNHLVATKRPLLRIPGRKNITGKIKVQSSILKVADPISTYPVSSHF